MSEIPAGSVIVTPEDMWGAIGEIRDTGHRTEAQITELRLGMMPAISDLRQDVDDNARIEREHHEKTGARVDLLEDKHDKRITALEQQSWSSRWIPVLVTSIITAAIAGLIIYFVTHLT